MEYGSHQNRVLKNWLDSFLAGKTEQFFWDDIHKLTERWENGKALDGQCFDNTMCMFFLNVQVLKTSQENSYRPNILFVISIVCHYGYSLIP